MFSMDKLRDLMVKIVEKNPDIVCRILKDKLSVNVDCVVSTTRHDDFNRKLVVEIKYDDEVINRAECKLD